MRLLTAQVREQAAQIQKVSAQLEAGKPAPQEKNRDVSTNIQHFNVRFNFLSASARF
jgi:hypothetical protein